MAEEVVSPYLWSKFSSILREAEGDSSSPSQIISRFQSIERRIDPMSSANRPRIPVDDLYNLIDALSECRILAYRRHQAGSSKKGFFRFIKVLSPLSELLPMKKMKKRLDEIETNLGKEVQQSSTPSPRLVEIQQTYPVLDPSRIIGFEAEAEKIENLLMDKQHLVEGGLITTIGIVGMCGSGKTQLAQKVFASPIIQNEFSPRIWVCLSNMVVDNERVDDARVRVLKYILEETGYDVGDLEYGDFSLNNLLEELHRRLEGKRFLIVLDKVWRVDEWYAADVGEFFSHGLPKGSGGGVIVTSRRYNVIRRTVGDDHMYVIRLEPHLSDDVCGQVFSDVVRQEGNIELKLSKLEITENEIIRNCDGLPIAAKTLGNIIIQSLWIGDWIGARELEIVWGNDTRYWNWTSLPHPELDEVAELAGVCWLEIKGNINSKMLLPKTRYSPYFVFKLKVGSYGLEKAKTEIRYIREEKVIKVLENHNVSIDRKKIPGEQGCFPQQRGQGWMEIKLGEFCNNPDDDGFMQASLFETKRQNWKSGLIVKGIEVRPSYIRNM